MKYLQILIFVIVCQLVLVSPVKAEGWDFYFFGVNTKTFKEADWKMVVLGAVTSAAVHTAGHYAYAGIHGISVRQEGLSEMVSFSEYSPQRNREFLQSGFIAQHFVGLILTTVPYTRQTDFTRGYVALAWIQTVTYPIRRQTDGDLYWSQKFGGNRDLEFIAYTAVATHNVLRVNWSKQ